MENTDKTPNKNKFKIFEIFKRLHAVGEYEVAGIGLAIVKRIIDRHGGRVWAEFSLGKGSNFYFTIPIKFNKSGSKCWMINLSEG